MESIKKIIVVISVVFVGIGYVAAQNGLQEAFEASYTFEYTGEYAKAIDVISKVYNEKSYEINLRAGWLNYEAGLYIEAQNYYKKAIALSPNSLEAKFGYIVPTNSLGNMDQVIVQYNKILEIDPQNTTANYQLGLIYYNRENFKQGYKYFNKVVSLYPFGYDALLMYAWTNYKMDKKKEAKDLFKKVLLLYPTDNSALEGLSLIK